MTPVSTDSYAARGLLAPSVGNVTPDRRRIAFMPLHIVVTTLVAVAGVAAIGLRLYESPESHAPIAVATGATAIGLIAYARYFLRLPWLSASVVYLMLFWMFHFGMTFTSVLVPSTLERIPDSALEWFNWPNVRMAMILGVIGAAGFVFGAGLFADPYQRGPIPPADRSHDSGLFLPGWLIMLVGIAASVLIVALTTGLSVFYEGYFSFLFLSESTLLGTALGLTHLGCLLAICGAGGRRWIKPFAVWGLCVALPMLLLGTRAGVMISLLGFAVVLTHRGVRFSRPVLATALAVALVAIPAIQAFRVVGFANRSQVAWMDVTPIDTFMELGGSLRSTKAYVDWIEQGDDHLLGLTYWAPFDRQLLIRVVPGREPIPYEKDERVPQRMMVQREGPFGGSATGEAYYNFGAMGPFLYFAFVGALFGWLERFSTRTAAGCVTLGIVMFVFYFNIRGDWLAVPATIAQGLALLGCCVVVRRAIASRWPRSRTASVPGLPART